MDTGARDRLIAICERLQSNGIIGMIKRAQNNRELYLLAWVMTDDESFDIQCELGKLPDVKAFVSGPEA